ncbi:MAG: response regulator [Desulfobacterales bacterium]|nr:response regulator [Desulfobacterales bacterium]
MVRDTGSGIDREFMGRIFDPFFTTKGKGKGTGLGLAVVHGILKSHGGAITVHSEQGKGAAFHVFLPRVDRRVSDETQTHAPIPKGNGRILFVDDKQDVVDMGKRMLEGLGYEVVATTSSVEAEEAFCTNPARFDLVITDQTMPNMTGTDLAQELIRIRPNIPIILCTGYSEQITPDTAKTVGIREFVMKPFVMREMATAIKRVLDTTE